MKVTKRKGLLLGILMLAICSAVAIFADAESTGNLSMALNGAGIAQLVTVVGLIYIISRL